MFGFVASYPLAAFLANARSPRWVGNICRSKDHTLSTAHARGRSRYMQLSMQATPVGAEERDVLLGELAFTNPDLLPGLVMEKLDDLNDEFYQFVDEKIAASVDLEERQTLRLLMEAVKQLQVDAAEQRKVGLDPKPTASAESDTASSEESILKPADEKQVADETYHALIDRFVAASEETDAVAALKAITEVEYEAIDKHFLDLLGERLASAKSDSKKEALERVKGAIGDVMRARMSAAATKLKEVLTAGTVENMQRKLDAIAAKGGLDDAFLLLLQGNMDQAKDARINDAVKVLTVLMDRAMSLRDSKSQPEIRLLRKLLRTPEKNNRINMLTIALRPNKGVLLSDGSKTSGVRVNGKKFVESLRVLLEKYSNIDAEFSAKLNEIGEESEEVARKLFDMEDKDVKDLQEEAFNKRTVSVWDLEKVEMQEEIDGKKAAWEGRLGNIPAGFDEHGKMQV